MERRIILLLIALWAIFETGAFAQNSVVFSGTRLTVEQALSQIESQCGKTVAYNEGVVNVKAIVTAPSGQMTAEEALGAVLGQIGAEFSISGDQIVITKRQDPQDGKITYRGKVVDNTGAVLPGVAILVQESGDAVMTAPDGSYEVSAAKGQHLVAMLFGFKDLTVECGESALINLTMTPDNLVLEESVVIGYGTVKRKDITTAVTIVSTKDVDTRPIVSAGSILQGKAAGVQVIQPSGMPGTGISIRVRGATSVQASNEPLYVVDGIPTDDISNIASDDIESIQVLKDASSSAIYGARAANGVVLIQTKRGQGGKTEVKFTAYAGISRLGRKIDALDTEQYKDLMKELADKTVAVPNIPDEETRYTDWTDQLFGTGVDQNYQMSISSGNDKLRYHVSAGHQDEKGIVNKAYFKRTNFRANIDSDLYKWLSASFDLGYAHNQGRTVYESRSAMRAGSILSAVNTPPFMQVWDQTDPTIYDENAYGARILNPMAANAADMTTASDRLQGSLSLILKPFEGFNYRLSYSMDLNNSRSDYYLDPLTTSDGRSTNGYVSEGQTRNNEWLLENIASYERSIDRHSFSLMAGASLQHALWQGSSLAGYDLPLQYPDLHSVAVANQIDEDATWGSSSAWSLASFLGRVSYNFDDRYLLTANARYDGSSRFAPGHRWGFFPSVSGAWRISNEDFMADCRTWMDDLKIRAGYGLNGNQGGIGNYAYLASMSYSKVAPTEDNAYPGIAIAPNSAANPDLTWEKTRQLNVGIDLSLLGTRVMLTADAYYKKTEDLLLTVTLPDNVNLPGGITRNDGEMENKGVELTLSTKNFVGDFKWNTDFNISFNKNKLLKLGLNKVYYYAGMYETSENAVVLREGLPLGSFFGYKALGVNVDTGDIDYEDISGNGIIGPEDRTVIGCAQPKFTYGFTNDFSWKGLALSVFFQGSYGNQIFNASRIDTEGMLDFRNQSTAVLRRWKRPGMETDIPRSGNVDNIHNSSRFVEDGSYLRLKSLTLSYTLPATLTSRAKISNVKVFVTGQNLLTLTKYSGYDPEVNAYGASSVALGVDYGTYPQSKAVIFGASLQF